MAHRTSTATRDLGQGWMLAIMLVHGFTYAALSWVLIRERARSSGLIGSHAPLHDVLLASLGVLATGFVLRRSGHGDHQDAAHRAPSVSPGNGSPASASQE